MTIYLAPLVCIIGALMYGLASNSKVTRIGEIAFFCGLLVTLLTMTSGSFKLH